MTIFDLVLILAVLGCILAILSLCYFLVRRQWRQAKLVLLLLGSFLVLYAMVLVSVSLLSPQRVLAMRQDRCFDDWCMSVERVVLDPTVGTMPNVITAKGTFYLVTVRVSSRAKAITQRALDAQVYLLDTHSQRYDPSLMGQQALDANGQSGQPLDSELQPGGSFTRTIVFDIPKSSSHLALVVTHGLFPDELVISSEQSFLHKTTIFQLEIS
jgi:Domain of unknown function (DUF4352)